MKGSYIGKKPSGYSAISASKTGAWEIYDQGQMVRDTQWTGQPWEVNNGYYLNKKWTVGLNLAASSDIQFNDDGTKLYILDQTVRTIYQYACTTAWDVTTAFYTGNSFSVNTQESNPNGLFFKSDGTKFYIVGQTNNTVFQYSCGVAWDISTAFYDRKAFSISAQETSPRGLFFKPDGTKFYIVGTINLRVYQYSCATAWDVSTASYDTKLFSVAAQETTPNALFFKSDGTKFYIVGQTNDNVYQYSCATAWDVSTGSYDTKFCRLSGIEGTSTGLCFKSDGTTLYVIGTTLSSAIEFTLSTAWDVSTNNGAGGTFFVGGQETASRDVHFKSDGTSFYVVGTTNATVYQYTCATAWDVSTASYASKSFSVNAQDIFPQGLFFKTDGTKFYIVGSNSDTIYQYSCATAWDVSTGSYDTKSFSVGAQDTGPQSLFFKSDGTKFYITGTTNDTVYQYSCATAWDVSTASYDTKSFSVTLQDSDPTGLFFKSDGTRLYITGTANDNICQYDLPLAWDVVNAGFGIKAFPVNLQEINPTDLTFSLDGTKLYIIGTVSRAVLQYICSTAWDITTAVFNYNSSGAYGRARTVNQDNTPSGVFFKSDGTTFYMIGTTTDTIYQYSCATAWDVSTASYSTKSFSVGGQETNSNALFFKPDGTKFYIVGSTNDTVYQYSCATAWDISTASYDSKSFSVTTQESSPQGLFFKSDGTKFYVAGTTNNTVYQYSCATAWDVSTSSYDNKSFNVSLQGTSIAGITLDDSGRFLYSCEGTTPDTVYQYSLV